MCYIQKYVFTHRDVYLTNLHCVGVCQYLYDHPEGLDSPFEDVLYKHIPKCERFSHIVAKAGDVFITHGLLPHTNGQNHLHYARVITNPHVNLVEPYNLNRVDGDYVSSDKSRIPGLWAILSKLID